MWFVLPHIYPLVQYDVYSQEPQLHVEPLAGEWAAGALRGFCAALGSFKGARGRRALCSVPLYETVWGASWRFCLGTDSGSFVHLNICFSVIGPFMFTKH